MGFLDLLSGLTMADQSGDMLSKLNAAGSVANGIAGLTETDRTKRAQIGIDTAAVGVTAQAHGLSGILAKKDGKGRDPRDVRTGTLGLGSSTLSLAAANYSLEAEKEQDPEKRRELQRSSGAAAFAGGTLGALKGLSEGAKGLSDLREGFKGRKGKKGWWKKGAFGIMSGLLSAGGGIAGMMSGRAKAWGGSPYGDPAADRKASMFGIANGLFNLLVPKNFGQEDDAGGSPAPQQDDEAVKPQKTGAEHTAENSEPPQKSQDSPSGQESSPHETKPLPLAIGGQTETPEAEKTAKSQGRKRTPRRSRRNRRRDRRTSRRTRSRQEGRNRRRRMRRRKGPQNLRRGRQSYRRGAQASRQGFQHSRTRSQMHNRRNRKNRQKLR